MKIRGDRGSYPTTPVGEELFEFLQRRAAGIVEINLVVFAADGQSFAGNKCMQPLNVGRLIGIGTDVQQLRSTALTQALQPHIIERGILGLLLLYEL